MQVQWAISIINISIYDRTSLLPPCMMGVHNQCCPLLHTWPLDPQGTRRTAGAHGATGDMGAVEGSVEVGQQAVPEGQRLAGGCCNRRPPAAVGETAAQPCTLSA